MKASLPPKLLGIKGRLFTVLKNSKQLQACKNVFIVATGQQLHFSPAMETESSLAKTNYSSNWHDSSRKTIAPIKYGTIVVGLLEIENGDENTEFLLNIFANSLSSFAINIIDKS